MKFATTLKRSLVIGGKDQDPLHIDLEVTGEELLDLIWGYAKPEDVSGIVELLVRSFLAGEPWEGLADIFEVLYQWLEKQEWDDDQLAERDQLFAAMRNFMRRRSAP